jgi:NAD(P)-dependent dehydrogenase (short-subunit alcohol dehydrogenase family)
MAMGTDRKTVLVTGATDGLGLAVCIELARRGHRLIVHGRDNGKLNEAVSQIRAAGGDIIGCERADFLALAEVDAMADRLIESRSPADVLINNAGIGAGYAGRQRAVSRDGLEARFAVNYLASFHLTERLAPLLIRNAPARIVNVASLGQHTIDFTDPFLARGFDGQQAYGQSKLAQIMHTIDLSERLRGTGVTVNAVHPGTLMPTKIVLEGWSTTIDSLETGVQSVVRLAVDDEQQGVTGMFIDKVWPGAPLPQAHNRRDREALAHLSRELVVAALKRMKLSSTIRGVEDQHQAS